MITPLHTPVVICGAGAAGSTLALLLASRGIASTILDRRHDPLSHPAAHVINARSLEIWREIDTELAAQIAALSPPISDINLIRWCSSVGATPLGEIDLLSEPEQLDRVRSHSDYLISHVGQHLLMPLLWTRLDAEPLISFHRDVTVTDVVPDRSGATVHTHSGTAAAPFVVAADGANSVVRDLLGITMQGPVLARMASAFFRSPDLHPRERPLLTWIYQPDFAGVLIAHADDHYILMGTYVHPGQPIASDAERYWRTALPRVLGADKTYEMKSTGTWTMTSQTASSFRSGPVLLVGDAAHRLPHTGGYGLNSGVQDAHNLAWKLGAVLNCRADDTLLDTYEIERRPVVELFAEHSVRNHFTLDAVTKHFGATNRALQTVTTLMGKPPLTWMPDALAARASDQLIRAGLARTAVLGRDSARARRVRDRAAQAIPDQVPHFVSTGLEFGYRYAGPLIAGDETPRGATVPGDVVEYVPTVVAGGRLPHVAVDVGDERRSILELVDRSPVLLTVMTTDPDAWRERLDPDLINPLEADIVDVRAACVAPDSAEQLYGLTRGGAVVVRCDGHIVWHTADPAEQSAEDLLEFLAQGWARLIPARPATAEGHATTSSE